MSSRNFRAWEASLVGVKVDGIGKDYGTQRVLEDISLVFAPGGFTSLLGPSGSGKTTLLRIIAGFVSPDRGTVHFGDADVTRQPVWRRNVGMVFQSYALFPHMSVYDNVCFGLNRRGVRGVAAEQQVKRALEMVQLIGFDHRRPKELSGGQQQRVALARAIVTRPSVLLLDEPLSALDRRLRQGMQIELRRIQRESGLTTIFVTHDQDEALTLSDEVAILDGGRIVQRGTPAEVYERPATRFVARFLGEMNLFSGPVANGIMVIAGQTLRAAEPVRSSGTVTFAVRPEKLRFLPLCEPATDPSDNRIEVVLREVIYSGAVSTYVLTTDDGTEIKVVTQHLTALAPALGARVLLSWLVADTHVLTE